MADQLNDPMVLQNIISRISPAVLLALEPSQLNDAAFLRGVLNRITAAPAPTQSQPAPAETQSHSSIPAQSQYSASQGPPLTQWQPQQGMNPAPAQIQAVQSAPPIVGAYQSPRLAGGGTGHPSHVSTSFRGVQTGNLGMILPNTPQLDLSQPITDANQTRRSSADRNLPRPNRRIRRRGAAERPPAIYRPSVEDCKIKTNDQLTAIRLQVNVWPNKPLTLPSGTNRGTDTLDRKHEVVFHTSAGSRATAWRRLMGLEHRYTVAPNTTLTQVFARVKDDMGNHAFHYQFPDFDTEVSVLQFFPDRGQVFLLMEFNNGGRPDVASHVRLRPAPSTLDSTTVMETLLSHRTISILPFAIIDGHFVINIRLKRPVHGLFSLHATGLGEDHRLQWHDCMAEKFYATHRFRYDVETNISSVPDEVSDCETVDDPSDSEDGEQEELESIPARTRPALPVPRPLPTTRARVSHSDSENDPPTGNTSPVAGSSSEVLHSQTTQPAPFLRRLQAPAQQSLTAPPPRLIPVLGLWRIVFNDPRIRSNFMPRFTSDDFTLRFFEVASETGDIDNSSTYITSESMSDLVSAFQGLIVEGREEHDYSALLCKRRSFAVRGPHRISPGDGVEEEAVSTMFNRLYLVEPNKSRFFKTLYNDHDSIAFSLPMRSSGDISVDRLQDMQDFGAATALMLLYGKYPGLFSPFFLQFCIRALDIHSLTETFIRNLIDVGHEGDLAQFNSIFQSYCDSSAHAYHPRTERAHDLLASSVLYQCVIGREPPLHAELQAFMKGFSLKTRNGFEFPSTLVNAYPGGSEGFLSLVNLSQITGYHSISQHTVFSSPGVTFESQMNNILDLDPVFKFQDFMIDFLQGSGTPLQAHWEHSVPMFNTKESGLPLDAINEPWFRSRMFNWSVTGAPELRSAILNSEQEIKVILCNANHPQYGDSDTPPEVKDNYARRGQLCMHTCASTLLVPAIYFTELSSNVKAAVLQRNPHATSGQVRKAIVLALHSWLLVELLNGIGKHNIL
ncbi:hypothetical protein C8J56DRAFT_888123 [Mycena floridula]|nr:hypothetical protein C8J56DRAFT_888123 [Mycena floridula]